MPVHFNLWLGRRLGTVLCLLSGKRTMVVYANLKAAFTSPAALRLPSSARGEKTLKELKRITKDVYGNLAQTFAEVLSMTKMDKRYIKKFVDIRGLERVEKASKNPKGMILLSAHFGNWELAILTSSMKGFPLYLLAREQKMKRLNELLNILRESKGNSVIRKGADVKNIFRVLRKGKSVGILADQNAGAGGELIDFMGRLASTATGPYRFAQKSGAWILPAFIHRVKGPYHELVVEPPMAIKKGEDIIPYMQEYNRLLEKHIRAHPDQWLWMHKRWKMTPVKKIMVLDDGKKGHLKQSLAVIEQLKLYREKEGYSPAHTEVDIVRIRFNSTAAKALFNAVSPFFAPRCQGCLRCLRMALVRESYEDAAGRYADVIISCGSTLAGVNKILKMENHARNLTVLDPGLFNRGKFDLIVVPRHDFSKRHLKGDKVIVTDLAPNLIRAGDPRTAGGRARGTDRRICMGVLFGGNNSCFTFGDDLTRSVAEGIKAACERIDGCFYATTSRRTPADAEKILKEEFRRDPRCMEFISGREDRSESTVEKILAASDVVLVSGESVSMVSEAVSSGKPVLVFMPDKRTGRHRDTKYERFVEGLRQRGYVRRVSPGEIPEEAVRVTGNTPETTAKFSLPDDNRRIYEKMHRLF